MKKLVAVVFLITTAAFSFAQSKYALVIGNGQYTNFGSLANAVNDANDMTAALEGLGFTVDKVLNGSRVEMVEGITRLKNRLSVSKNSYGFFFYAGHGVQYNGVNYLIPAKADIPNANYLGDTSISVQTMLAELNDAGNELNIVVLDACRDFPAAWMRSTNRGLTAVTIQPADSIIVYATSAGSTASDGTGRNGLFTSQLLKNLKTPDLEVAEVFRRTGSDVARASNRQQIPAVYGQFFETAYLGTRPASAQTTQPTPDPGYVLEPEWGTHEFHLVPSEERPPEHYSTYEGAGSMSPDLPTGFYIATNSYPRNSVVDVTNIENGRTVRAIVAASLYTPGLFVQVSSDLAEAIGLQSQKVGRIRMITVDQ